MHIVVTKSPRIKYLVYVFILLLIRSIQLLIYRYQFPVSVNPEIYKIAYSWQKLVLLLYLSFKTVEQAVSQYEAFN